MSRSMPRVAPTARWSVALTSAARTSTMPPAPGASPAPRIKPFIYSAALERGFAPATLINDVQLSATTTESLKWDPRNDDDKYDGPIRMQDALGAVQERGVGAHPQGHWRGLCARLS